MDILIPEDLENHARVIAALSQLEDHAAAELTPQDFVENVVVKIADEVEVDVRTCAWKVSYADARPTALRTTIGGIEVPDLDLATLIASKDTDRAQDRVDVQLLREIARRRPAPGASRIENSRANEQLGRQPFPAAAAAEVEPRGASAKLSRPRCSMLTKKIRAQSPARRQSPAALEPHCGSRRHCGVLASSTLAHHPPRWQNNLTWICGKPGTTGERVCCTGWRWNWNWKR